MQKSACVPAEAATHVVEVLSLTAASRWWWWWSGGVDGIAEAAAAIEFGWCTQKQQWM